MSCWDVVMSAPRLPNCMGVGLRVRVIVTLTAVCSSGLFGCCQSVAVLNIIFISNQNPELAFTRVYKREILEAGGTTRSLS